MGSRRASEEYDDLSLEGAHGMAELMIDEHDPYDDDLIDPNPQQTKIEQIIQDMSIPDDEISGAGEEEELPHAERRDDDHDDMDAVVERLNNGLNRAHFPVVSLPSLDQSANNTPRVSYGFSLSQYLPSSHANQEKKTRPRLPKGVGAVKEMVQEDAHEENHRGSSGPREEVARDDFRMRHANLKRPMTNSSALGQRLRDRELHNQLQMYQADIQMLQERIRTLEAEFEKAEAERQDVMDWKEMHEAQTESSLEAMRGRILAKAIEERDRAKLAKQEAEKELHQLETQLMNFQTENEAIRAAAEGELQELEDARSRAEATADGYRLSEAEAREELDAARKESLQLQRQLEGMIQKIHSQEEQMRMAENHINELTSQEDDYRSTINDKDHQIHKLARALENLQMTTEGLNGNRDGNSVIQPKGSPKYEEDGSEQISALNMQIHDLRRQLAAQKSQKQPISTQTDKKDQSANCSLLEEFYTQFAQRILEFHGLAEPGSEPSLKEVHTKLSQALSDLKSRCQSLSEENNQLKRTVDSQSKVMSAAPQAERGTANNPHLGSRGTTGRDQTPSAASVLSQQLVQQSIEFESKFSLQQESIRESQQKVSYYESLVKQSRMEVSTLLHDNEALKDRLAIANAKLAESSRIAKLQEEKLNGINREQQTSTRTSLMTTKQPSVVEREVQATLFDAEFESKVRQLEKQIRDQNSDLAAKTRANSELESARAELEEEVGRLRHLREEVSAIKKKSDAAEKKIVVLSQDISIRDKKNIELFELNKKLKSEIEELQSHNQALQEKLVSTKSSIASSTKLKAQPAKKSQMVAMSGASHIGNSSGDSAQTSLLTTPLCEEETARNKWLLENIEDARREMTELYQKVDRFYLEKNILLQNLEQQSKRSMSLAKEVQFLRGCLESPQQSEENKIELEMLSSEETELLLDKILKRALKSSSMQKRLRESMEFSQLCGVLARLGSKG